jgi:hypothetical protein
MICDHETIRLTKRQHGEDITRNITTTYREDIEKRKKINNSSLTDHTRKQICE